MLQTQWWRGFRLSRLILVGLASDFLPTAALNYLSFGLNGCKSQFIRTSSDARVNVHRHLTKIGIPIIILPFGEIMIRKKALTTLL